MKIVKDIAEARIVAKKASQYIEVADFSYTPFIAFKTLWAACLKRKEFQTNSHGK